MKQIPTDGQSLHPLILFDGPCNLCNASVLFVIDRDPAGVFRFASLQSVAGRAALTHAGLDPDRADSVVLIDAGRVWRESDAAVRIAARLAGPWRLLAAFRLVPRRLRDAVYRYVGRRRYAWFGREECRLPTNELRRRMVPGGSAGDSPVPASAPNPHPARLPWPTPTIPSRSAMASARRAP